VSSGSNERFPFLAEDPTRDGKSRITFDEFKSFVEHATCEKDWDILNRSLLVKAFKKEWENTPAFISTMDLLKDVKIYKPRR
jgi:hypothetical protein